MNTPTMYLPADMKVTELLELSSNIGSTILTVEGDLFLQTANGGRIALKVERRKKLDDAREQVAKLMGQTVEEMGHSQWIAHILKRLHLVNEGQRKRSNDGVAYGIDPAEVRDVMRRYDVDSICETDA